MTPNEVKAISITPIWKSSISIFIGACFGKALLHEQSISSETCPQLPEILSILSVDSIKKGSSLVVNSVNLQLALVRFEDAIQRYQAEKSA